MVNFDRIVPVINPHSSNIARAREGLEEIYDAYPTFYDPHLRPMETSPNVEQTTERIRNGTRDGDLVVALFGDGPLRSLAEATAGRDITSLLLPAGNGCDAAHDLNSTTRPASELISKGETVAIHPIDVTIDSLKRHAVNYFEIGSKAKGAMLLNSRMWRHLPGYHNDSLRLLYELAILPPTALLARRFKITEDDTTHKAINTAFLNSRHQAKLAKVPTHLADTRIFMTECANQVDLITWAIDALKDKLKGTYLEKGQARTIHIGRTVFAHTDAEPFAIERGSKVTVKVAETPFYAVSTRQH